MESAIIPYDGNSMKLWPPLADRAFYLKSASGGSIFFYDSPPQAIAGASISSPPTFVLIHGLGDEADSWRHLIPLLNARGYRVLAPDLPGFGRSAASGRISLKTHADAVLELVEKIGRRDWESGNVKSPPSVFLAGSSMGAMVAEAAAFRKPGKLPGFSPAPIRGLALIDGSIPGGPSNPGPLVLAKLLFSRKWYRAYRGNPEGAWRSLYPYYADLDSLSEEDKEFLKVRVMARVESDSQERAYFATQSSLIWAFLTGASKFAKKIRQYEGKILLLWGDKDRIIPLSSTKAIMALRPDIELKTIPGAGHLPQQERPEETARLLAEFAEH